MTSLFWFRRDLRLADHPALTAALDEGPVVPVFVVDPALWGPAGQRRRSYLAASLAALSADIEAMGGPGLTVLQGSPEEELPELAASTGADACFATADFGPYGRQRDERAAAALPLRTGSSPYLHPPGSVRKGDGSAYRVFTPFYRAWAAREPAAPAPSPSSWPAGPDTPRGTGWDLLAQTGPPPFAVGEAAAWERWERFAVDGLASYDEARNNPAAAGTSGLSAALKFGEIHPRSIVASAAHRPGADAFVRQLAWRDFYGQILTDRPDSARGNYLRAFDAMPWDSGPAATERFRAWQDGRTGYPFVDAGMRQLAQTGYLHNRLRMVVASFLVKDLHLDWRWGAAHFMDQLYDGDLANNQHGWQWTAGTGTDASPYYRIFNPVNQGLKFDPTGEYVHRWLPELRDLPGPAAHEPWEHPRDLWPDYPEQIVDHGAERVEALARYEVVKAAKR